MPTELKAWVQRAYDQVHAALWAGLVALILLYPIVLPQMRERWAAYEAQVAAETSAENDSYCRRFQFIPATNAYRSCLDDLQRLRASIEKRLAADYDF
ncbi:MAG: hypothetical protein ACTHKE_09270 [Sphingomicrobium sp.]